jgi:hypothetical protein
MKSDENLNAQEQNPNNPRAGGPDDTREVSEDKTESKKEKPLRRDDE